MLHFEAVTIAESYPPLSFGLAEGTLGKITADSDKSKDILLELMLGLTRPSQGKISLFNHDLSASTTKEIYQLRTRCGVVLSGGGLISNLKIRENLALPLQYHAATSQEAMEDILMELLGQTGILPTGEEDFIEYFGRPPGLLSFYEKRIMALVRAMSLDPLLMIYDSVLEGISKESAQKILEFTLDFHRQKPGRASLYLTVHEDTLEPIKTPWVIRVEP